VSRLVRAYHAAKFRPRSRLGRLLNKHRGEIVAIASKHKASNVRVFGSVARGEDGPSSDIDLLVDLAADADLFDIAGLNVELQRLLGHPVDVVPARMLKPRVASSALSDALRLWSSDNVWMLIIYRTQLSTFTYSMTTFAAAGSTMFWSEMQSAIA
jgi:uncharacterized protein